MKHILSVFLLICAYIMCNGQAQTLVIDNQTPGWLSSKINYSDQETLKNLTVKGYLNGTDIRFIRELNLNNSLQGVIDLSDANIVPGGDAYYFENKTEQTGAHYTQKNLIDNYIFCGLKPISRLVLPRSTEDIYTQAFSGEIDSLVVDCPKVMDFFLSSQHIDMKYLYLGEGIERVYLGHLFCCGYKDNIGSWMNVNKFAYEKETITIHLPSTLKSISDVYGYRKGYQPAVVRIYSDILDPENVKGDVPLFGKNDQIYGEKETQIGIRGLMVVPEGTLEKYEESIFNGLTIKENIVEPHTLELSDYDISVYVDQIKRVTIYVNEEPSENLYYLDLLGFIRWFSADENIAVSYNELANDGWGYFKFKVRGVGFGSTVMKATTSNGLTATCNVKVYEHVSNIEIPESMELTVGETDLLEHKLYPIGRTQSKIGWESSDPEIAVVDANGNVGAIKTGEAIITATTEDGGHTAQCVVTVTNPAGIDPVMADEINMVKIYSLSGVLVYQGTYSEANLEKGCYIVVCNGHYRKVIIK